MIQKTILILSLIACFLIIPGVKAMIAPEIYLTEISLEKDNYQPREEIRGTVSLWNYEKSLMPDLTFRFQLLGHKIDGIPTQIIDDQKQAETFNLFGGEKTARDFSYALPANLPDGELVFRLQITNSQGEEMAWIDRDISVESETRFVTLDNYWVVKEEELTDEMKQYFELTGQEPGRFHPQVGVNYQPGESPEITFDITNDFSESLTGFSKITVYERNQGNGIKHENREPVSLEPNQTITQNISLPEFKEPESYLAEIRFYDDETKEQVSNVIYLRWVVAGKDDAEILYIKPDKTFYQKGEEARIEIIFVGPADGTGFEGDETLEVRLYDHQGEIIAETSREIEPGINTMLANLSLKEEVFNPRIEAQIIKGGKLLDSYGFSLGPEPEIEEPGFIEKNRILIISILVLILIVLIAIIIISRSIMKKKQIDISLFLILFAGSLFLFGAGQAWGVVEVEDGCFGGTLLEWSSPLPDQTFHPGDTIEFRGTFDILACNNVGINPEYTFYITEDPSDDPLAIPIKECCGTRSVTDCVNRLPICDCPNGCMDCYGDRIAIDCASYLGTWLYDLCVGNYEIQYLHGAGAIPAPWLTDQVKVLDQTQGHKIYKLGKYYPGFSAPSWPPVFRASYGGEKCSFTIPSISDLGFSGPVRFYVQASSFGNGGLNRSYWQWNISYQKGFIEDSVIGPNTPPAASSLNFNLDDCLGHAKELITLAWDYNDLEGDRQKEFHIQVFDSSNNLVVNIADAPTGPLGPNPPYSNSYPIWIVDNPTPATNDNDIKYNDTYTWQVKVSDIHDNWSSDWVTGSFTVNDEHARPISKFSWIPADPLINQEVSFRDDTVYYGGSSGAQWEWDFGDGNTSSDQNPTNSYSVEDDYQVSLKVTDSDGYSCPPRSRDISLTSPFIPVPKWKEIIPF